MVPEGVLPSQLLLAKGRTMVPSSTGFAGVRTGPGLLLGVLTGCRQINQAQDLERRWSMYLYTMMCVYIIYIYPCIDVYLSIMY